MVSKEYIRDYQLKKNYGISLETYNRLYEIQSGLCMICMLPETRKVKGTQCKLSVDHCHVSKRLRGLICSKCNGMLGLLEIPGIPVPEKLKRIDAYLDPDRFEEGYKSPISWFTSKRKPTNNKK